MNKFKFYFILLITAATIFSCNKDDDNPTYTIEPPRDYGVQYKTDSTAIDTYLRTHYITVTEAPGQTADQDVVMTKIPAGGTQPSIMSYLNAASFPKLKSKIVNMDGVKYTLYYLVLREGIGKSPCNVDGVLASYTGSYIYQTTATATVPSEYSTTEFEKATNPSTYLSLFTTIAGWGETFPEFKMGTYSAASGGSVSYKDFGAGVMFLPSGLAYYNNSNGTIPVYSPLIFSFKLYDVQRLDQDNDGIPSYLEDLDGDGYLRLSDASKNYYPDDTDHDGIPDFYDIDDDGDNYTTRLETQYIHPDDPNKIVRYYPFNGETVDNPATLYVDESKGIPGYTENGIYSYTDPSRKRIHLDPKHH